MPTTVGPDGEPEGEGDPLAVPSSAPSRFRARAVGGGTRPTQWVARTAESVPWRTTIPCLDSVAAAVRYPGWAVEGVGSEAEQEPGAGSWLMTEGRQNGPLMSSPRWMIKGRVADGKSMIALIGRAVAVVQTVGTSDIGGGGGGYDGGGHSAGFGRGGMAQAEPAGADAIE